MSHPVFAHYIFNILLSLLLLLLIGFLYSMPFIYKDTKKMFVILITFSPSCNIQSYFINSLNQKHFPSYIYMYVCVYIYTHIYIYLPTPSGKITQYSSGYEKDQPHNPVLQFLKWIISYRGLTDVRKLIQWYKNK
ncbi:unnamed protein product [Rangifer tarandus platyrhynchus]|uniref:Uncharacterized protein n=1 Tax=Rangifer tarandus platyrhynchus TaxID=3082113 RepID=A0AC59YVD3_RANTA